MSELPDLSAQKPYALDQLAQLQGKIIQLSKSMVLQRARIERCRQSDLAAARDIYAELSRTRETLVETLAQVQLFLMEMEEYALAKVSGQLRQGLAGFALMSTGYKSVYEALSRFASSLPVGQKTNAAVVGRLMNNIKLGYYPTDPDNIALLLRGIKFPEGVTTNLLDPAAAAARHFDNWRRAITAMPMAWNWTRAARRKRRQGFTAWALAASFIVASAAKLSICCFLTRRISRSSMRAEDAPGMKSVF